MEKQNAEMMEYLKSLENIVQFQSYVLEHIHDDFQFCLRCFQSALECGNVDIFVYRVRYC